MAARSSLDDKLAAIRALRHQSLGPADIARLRKWIGDRSNFVVAAATAVAEEHALIELAGDLEQAFDRFLIDPLTHDKLCRAKLAIVQALDKMEHQRLEVFEKAATYIQFEPAWGAPVDTAVPLRAAALIAVARIDGTSALPLLVDAMVDSERDVRIAAAGAMGAIGNDAAELLLRLKARIGDKDSEVLSECLSGLLTANHRQNLPFVIEFLDPNVEFRCEAAALALGKSRLAEALAPLEACLSNCHSAAIRQHVLLAIAMLRLPAAIDFLLNLLASDPEPTALAVLAALKIHNHDTRIRDRVAQYIHNRASRTLQSRFDQDFPAADH
jgi:HEAT repeat protein